MTNLEKYRDEILRACLHSTKCTFKRERVLGGDCRNLRCKECDSVLTEWLDAEYREPEVDWSKVEVDTPILVQNRCDARWFRKHFAKYENGKVYAWTDGCTSFTSEHYEKKVFAWDCAKLAEEK